MFSYGSFSCTAEDDVFLYVGANTRFEIFKGDKVDFAFQDRFKILSESKIIVECVEFRFECIQEVNVTVRCIFPRATEPKRARNSMPYAVWRVERDADSCVRTRFLMLTYSDID